MSIVSKFVEGSKDCLKKRMHNACYNKMICETERQKDAYRQWCRENENWKTEKLKKGAPSIGNLESDSDIILFLSPKGRLAKNAETVIANYFAKYPYTELVYADEDIIGKEEKRSDPWFKPRWSPDTLDSFQYFGNIVAVRRKWVTDCKLNHPVYSDLRKITGNITKDYLKKNPQNKICQIPSTEEKSPIGNIDKVLFHMKEEWEDEQNTEKHVYNNQKEQILVSVIIPSKDNQAVLETCIRSILDKTTFSAEQIPYEILVMDNGSNKENKNELEKLAQKYQFTYIYEVQEFNFSAMCNKGVKNAKGNLLLFLNDDIEIIQGDWLEKMCESAGMKHVGAVGVKLLFPETDLMQHVGITNLDVGPAHKLLKLSDKSSYYHGHNRFVYDMIGVTAACLMVRREVFEEVEGFYEGLKVSYNDVDFCFKIFEKGYYNVARNDLKMYHHESLSRGDDNLSEEKWCRLLLEKEQLYNRHPALRGNDPFYSKNLAQHTHVYGINYLYDFEKRDRVTPVKPWKKAEPIQWSNECLILNVEHSRLQKKLDQSEKYNSFWIEGWSYVFGMDNSHYKRTLLLIGEKGMIFEVPVLVRYRKDVIKVLPEQRNVELSGFVCGIPVGTLPEDTYAIGMLAKDSCSSQKLYRKSEAKLVVQDGETKVR